MVHPDFFRPNDFYMVFPAEVQNEHKEVPVYLKFANGYTIIGNALRVGDMVYISYKKDSIILEKQISIRSILDITKFRKSVNDITARLFGSECASKLNGISID